MRQIDQKFIDMAEEVSSSSSLKYKHGAVLVRDKEIISIGFNRMLGIDPVLTRYGLFYSLHAEMDALRKIKYLPQNTTLYITRRNQRHSAPCSDCWKIIHSIKEINRVVFSGFEGELVEVKP